MKARLFVFSFLWLGVTVAALSTSSCYGRNCDAGFFPFGADAGEGKMINADKWQSGPADGPFLFFPGNHTYQFEMRQLGGRKPAVVYPYVSGNMNPNATDQTIGSGNIATISNVNPNHVDVHNGSCSSYYLRVVVEAEPFPPEPPDDVVVDSGIADAGTD